MSKVHVAHRKYYDPSWYLFTSDVLTRDFRTFHFINYQYYYWSVEPWAWHVEDFYFYSDRKIHFWLCKSRNDNLPFYLLAIVCHLYWKPFKNQEIILFRKSEIEKVQFLRVENPVWRLYDGRAKFLALLTLIRRYLGCAILSAWHKKQAKNKSKVLFMIFIPMNEYFRLATE